MNECFAFFSVSKKELHIFLIRIISIFFSKYIDKNKMSIRDSIIIVVYIKYNNENEYVVYI